MRLIGYYLIGLVIAGILMLIAAAMPEHSMAKQVAGAIAGIVVMPLYLIPALAIAFPPLGLLVIWIAMMIADHDPDRPY